MKVLIVDDEPSIVNLIRMNLKLEGYDSVCAYSGREAVEAYAAQKPDIVLLDIMLPDMDGYDVLRAIQELDRSAAVIFITANDKRTSKILGLELGADDYITKPFDNKELVLRVKTLWRRIRLTRGAGPSPSGAGGGCVPSLRRPCLRGAGLGPGRPHRPGGRVGGLPHLPGI